jgi:hypothetical protein
MSTRIYLEPAGLGARGQRYRVIHSGVTLIESSGNPEFDACRALLARGITGLLESWHKDAHFAAMYLDIEKGARLTVQEGEQIGPRFVAWSAPPEVLLSNAVSSVGGRARMAANKIQVGGASQKIGRPWLTP